MQLIDQRVEVLKRIEFGFFFLALRLGFGLALARFSGDRLTSLHNVTILWFIPRVIIYKLNHAQVVSQSHSQSQLSRRPKTARSPPRALRIQYRHHTVLLRNPPKARPSRKCTAVIRQKLWEVSTGSKSQILMTIFMFWMFGNNISIFILFPIIQTLTTAVGGMLNMQKGKR